MAHSARDLDFDKRVFGSEYSFGRVEIEVDQGFFALGVLGSERQLRSKEPRLFIFLTGQLVLFGLDNRDVVGAESFDFEFIEDPYCFIEHFTKDRSEEI